MEGRSLRITAPITTDDDQEERRIWRSMLLVIRSRLEEYHSGITTFDEAFLPYLITGTGETVIEYLRPMLKGAGNTPSLPPSLDIRQ